jgi:hypothetical protein
MTFDVLNENMKELVEQGPVRDPESVATVLRVCNTFDGAAAVVFSGHVGCQDALPRGSSNQPPDPIAVIPPWKNC